MAIKFKKNKAVTDKVIQLKKKAKDINAKTSKFSTRILLTLISMIVVSSVILSSVAVFNITRISNNIMKDLFEQKLKSDGILFKRYIERDYGVISLN
ncbi:MAG: hypothetical protein J6W76_04270, partial [Spirochaetales bacterium]|nr:hypothetical protein [Spirochaetales bacterium]